MKQRIGDRYEFDRQTDVIGRGGMGTVYVGIDTTTGQKVAIKQLKPDIIQDNPDFVERFNREAEALRRLNHPNIVAVLDTIADDDAHYLIMEYVSGGSLWEEMQNNKPMPIARVLQIALDLSDALTRAHRQKIIHRDLKPANVLIAHDGTPRLTDFGVAQIQDKTRVTRTGAVVGTLNYLSPEALNGDPIDERTDIWAFGIMLYEMLAGRSPFSDESTTALITAILTKPATDLIELRPDVPPMLARLVEQMLIKEREKRVDSIRKVGSELEDILRQSDSDVEITSEFKRNMMAQVEGRFDTPTPSPAPTPLIKPGTSRHGVTIVKSDTGEEYVMMPKRFANRLPVIMGVLLVVAFIIGIFIMTRPRFNDNDTNITIVRPPNGDGILQNLLPNNSLFIDANPQAPIEEGEYPIMILPGTGPNSEDATLQLRIQEVLAGIFETDIAFSNIRIIAETPRTLSVGEGQAQLPLIDGVIQRTDDARAVLMVRPEQREDGLYVILQLGDLSRFPHNAFERSVIERLVNVEILVDS
ncbi:MAG: serine/threonine-protein kinase, partial [bacterium]|nr:serine/threonine-protein kinase [bacterium]